LRGHWLLPSSLGALSALVVTLPVQAAQLQSWWFDHNTNRLSFITDTGVQPRAQMIFNPTRIVIDLPGTTLGQPTANETFSGAVQEVRVGQFNPQTTRLVIELDTAHTVDPNQVEIRGLRSNQWIVQLPTPQSRDTPEQPVADNRISGQPVDAATQLESIVATPDGFFLRTQGPLPQISVQRRRNQDDQRQITIDLPNASISPQLRLLGLPANRYSISNWEVEQRSSSPPETRVTLTLEDASPDWQITTTNLGGIIVVPPAGVSINSIPDQPPPAIAARATGKEPDTSSQVRPAPPEPESVPIVPTPAPAETPRPAPSLPAVRHERVVVVLDPGHGGRDPGAVGINGLQEKQVIFPISQRVRQLLEQQGVQVVMTRYSDQTVELQSRVDIAERANADLFVSIHANAINLSRPDVNGIETYYFSAAGRRLAEVIHASMLSASGMNDRGVRQARFFVLRRTSMPATLLEVGFVTGAQDAPRLADPAWRQRMAEAIAQGILGYIQQNF